MHSYSRLLGFTYMKLGDFIVWIIGFIDRVLVPLVFAIAFIVFLWGVFQYFIAGAGDEEKRKEGRKFAMYGIIGFFLMLSIWGIVNLFTNTFGFNTQNRPSLPTFGPASAGTNRNTNGGGLGQTCTNNSECPANNSCIQMGDHKECFPD